MAKEEHNKIAVEKGFILVTCSCGCGGIYPKSKETKLTGHEKIDNNTIKRLSDNQIFKVGDTVERISETGISFGNMKIEKIRWKEDSFSDFDIVLVTNTSLVHSVDELQDNAGLPNFRYLKYIKS